jgi:hypothetical protein
MPSSAIPPDAATPPKTPTAAEAWVEAVVAWIGPRFHPDKSFQDYHSRDTDAETSDLALEQLDELDEALKAARRILGPRINDLAYRSSVASIRDPQANSDASPATQPPARWWLIERANPPTTTTFEPSVSIAYEDEHGTWWEWEPATQRLHSTPWLYTDYYYRAEGHGLRFSRLTPDEVRQRIADGLEATTAGDLLMAGRHQAQPASPNFACG